jgi:hypothetical protein
MAMKTKLLISGLAFMALTTIVSAQSSGKDQLNKTTPVKGLSYVDVNKNGICDNYENGTSNNRCQRNGNFNRRGQRKRCGQGQSTQGQRPRRNFVDEDKNGVCDIYEARVKK